MKVEGVEVDRRYRLLVLDIDGTLIGPDEKVPPATAEAIAAAHRAGLRVVLATGRTYEQAVGIWRQLSLSPPLMPLVLVSGALVAEPETGRTLYQKVIRRDLAMRFADALAERGRSTLAYVDGWRYEQPWYMFEADDAACVRDGWLARLGIEPRCVNRPFRADVMPDPLRLTAFGADREAVDQLAASLRPRFEGELCISPLYVPAYDVVLLEATAAAATKWTAVMYISQGWRIGPGQIVAVGDELNDLPMICGAGLGVSMPQAPPAVRQAADCLAEEGLEALVGQLLEGTF